MGESQKGCGFEQVGKWGGSWTSWEMRNSNQNILYEKKTTFNKKIKCQTKRNIPVKFTHSPEREWTHLQGQVFLPQSVIKIISDRQVEGPIYSQDILLSSNYTNQKNRYKKPPYYTALHVLILLGTQAGLNSWQWHFNSCNWQGTYLNQGRYETLTV